MEQVKQPTPQEIAAAEYAPYYYEGDTPQAMKREAFKAGAQWQKEQDKEILNLANQLLAAFNFRYPKEGQLLVGWQNKKAFEKIQNHLYPNS